VTHAYIVEPDAQLAAKRAFVRTMYQGYAATLSAGLTATAVLSAVQGFDALTTGVTVAVAVLSPPIAGLAAWLDMSRRGIPDEYRSLLDPQLF